MLREQADLRGARTLPTKTQKSAFVADALSSTAARVQAPLRALLDARGAEYRSYWVANMIWVRGDRNLVEELAAREDVFHVYANPWVALRGPVSSSRRPACPRAPTRSSGASRRSTLPRSGRSASRARASSSGGQDTGYQWDHPALKAKYRGWTAPPNHNYNWHDSIHSGGGSCGADSQAPCDDFGHGTHTMGTMVGDDGGNNQIGVAPAAKWIGCRNMDPGVGTPATYSECFQWFIAPTDLAEPESRSLGAPRDQQLLGLPARRRLHGPDRSCRRSSRTRARRGSWSSPRPATTAALRNRDRAAGDLRRVLLGRRDGQQRRHRGLLEPRPGHGRRQRPPEAGHVRAGREHALERSRRRVRKLQRHEHGGPARRRRRRALPVGQSPISSATRTGSSPFSLPPRCRARRESCGGVPGNQIPNNTYGWGRIDALAAFTADLGLTQTARPAPRSSEFR